MTKAEGVSIRVPANQTELSWNDQYNQTHFSLALHKRLVAVAQATIEH